MVNFFDLRDQLSGNRNCGSIFLLRETALRYYPRSTTRYRGVHPLLILRLPFVHVSFLKKIILGLTKFIEKGWGGLQSP